MSNNRAAGPVGRQRETLAQPEGSVTVDEGADGREAVEIPHLWTNVGRAIFDGTGEAVAAARSADEARRIVAAINAVYGMPTEALEAWTIGYIRDPMNDLLAQLESTLALEPPADDRRRADRRQADRRQADSQITAPPDADWVRR